MATMYRKCEVMLTLAPVSGSARVIMVKPIWVASIWPPVWMPANRKCTVMPSIRPRISSPASSTMSEKGCAGICPPGRDTCGHRARVNTRHSAALTCTGAASPPKKGSRNSTRLTRMKVSRKLSMEAASKAKMSMGAAKQDAGHGPGSHAGARRGAAGAWSQTWSGSESGERIDGNPSPPFPHFPHFRCPALDTRPLRRHPVGMPGTPMRSVRGAHPKR